MIPPEKVWVGTFEFPITLLPANHEKLDRGETDGLTEFNPPHIYIAAGMSLSALLETLWHEITHAVNHAADIEDGADEETIADTHGKFWSQFWINNPRFQRWWMQACVAVRKERG